MQHTLTPTDFSVLFAFWSDLTPQERTLLEQRARTETYRAGTILHRANAGCKGIMAVTAGALRVYCVSEEGREVTLYRVEAGDVCILSASCLMDSIVFDVLIEAVGDTAVCLLPADSVHRIEAQNPLVSLFIYKNATEKFSEVLVTLQELLFMKLDERLARALLEESARQHSTTLTITHEELAKQIGSAREVVTRTLQYLAKEGKVSLSRGKIKLLSPQELEALHS